MKTREIHGRVRAPYIEYVSRYGTVTFSDMSCRVLFRDARRVNQELAAYVGYELDGLRLTNDRGVLVGGGARVRNVGRSCCPTLVVDPAGSGQFGWWRTINGTVVVDDPHWQ